MNDSKPRIKWTGRGESAQGEHHDMRFFLGKERPLHEEPWWWVYLADTCDDGTARSLNHRQIAGGWTVSEAKAAADQWVAEQTARP